MLGLRNHDRLQDFVLVDNAIGSVFLSGWTIFAELATAFSVLSQDLTIHSALVP